MVHTKTTIFLAIFTTAILLVGCRRDEENFTPYGSSTTDIELSLRAQVSNPAAHTEFLFSGPTDDQMVATASGVRIFLTDTENLLVDAAGALVPFSACQQIKLEVTEALQRRDLFGQDIEAKDATGNLLEMGGFVRVKITCDGREMRLAPGRELRIILPVAAQANLQNNMQLYYETTENQPLTNWTTNGLAVFHAQWGNAPQSFGYDLYSDKLTWLACARPVSVPLANFCVSLPTHFNNGNTFVYAFFPDFNALVKMAGTSGSYDFCFAHSPIDYAVKLVTVSKIGDRWFLGEKDATVVAEGNLSLSPAEKTEAEVVQFLQNL